MDSMVSFCMFFHWQKYTFSIFPILFDQLIDAQKILRIKQLYDELELPAIYSVLEEESYKKLTNDINTITGLPHTIFHKILDKIYKREG